MKTTFKGIQYKLAVLAFVFATLQNSLLAQDVKAEIKGTDMGSWFSQNWLWVGAVVLLLVLILLFSGSRRRRVTTTTTNRDGNIKRTVTTEEEID
jgi:hypothetical protein